MACRRDSFPTNTHSSTQRKHGISKEDVAANVGRKVQLLLLLNHAEEGLLLSKLPDQYKIFFGEDLTPSNCKLRQLEEVCRAWLDEYVYFENQLNGHMHVRAKSLGQIVARNIINEAVLPYLGRISNSNAYSMIYGDSHQTHWPLSPASSVGTSTLGKSIEDDLLDYFNTVPIGPSNGSEYITKDTAVEDHFEPAESTFGRDLNNQDGDSFENLTSPWNFNDQADASTLETAQHKEPLQLLTLLCNQPLTTNNYSGNAVGVDDNVMESALTETPQNLDIVEESSIFSGICEENVAKACGNSASTYNDGEVEVLQEKSLPVESDENLLTCHGVPTDEDISSVVLGADFRSFLTSTRPECSSKRVNGSRRRGMKRLREFTVSHCAPKLIRFAQNSESEALYEKLSSTSPAPTSDEESLSSCAEINRISISPRSLNKPQEANVGMHEDLRAATPARKKKRGSKRHTIGKKLNSLGPSQAIRVTSNTSLSSASLADPSGLIQSCNNFLQSNELQKSILSKKDKYIHQQKKRGITFSNEMKNNTDYWTGVVTNDGKSRSFYMCPPESDNCQTFQYCNVENNWISIPELSLPPGSIFFAELIRSKPGRTVLNIIDVLCVGGLNLKNLHYWERRQKCLDWFRSWDWERWLCSSCYPVIFIEGFRLEKLSEVLANLHINAGCYTVTQSDQVRLSHKDVFPLSFRVNEILFLKTEMARERDVAHFGHVMGNRLSWKWKSGFNMSEAAGEISDTGSEVYPDRLLQCLRKYAALDN